MASRDGVLILVENLPVPFDRRVWLEANTLRENGYSVSVICPKGSGARASYEELEGIRIYRYPTPPPTKGRASYIWEFVYCWLATFFLSIKVLVRDRFKIIHACNPPDTFFVLGAIYKLLGKKFVFDQHDLCPEVFLARFKARKRTLYKILLLLEKWTYKTADIVLATNLSYKEIAMKRGGVPEDRLFVVRSAPDLNRFHSVEPVESLRKGRKYLVSYLGVMAPQDGVDHLLQSIDHIVKTAKRRDIHFAIIGSGDSFASLKRMSSELELDEYVEFTGRIPDRDVERYLSTSDVCVSPDPKNELNDVSTMNKVLEYMAMSKPVVAFDLKETSFSVRGGALYAVPNDVKDFAKKILALIDDEKLRKRMGEENRKRFVQELSWELNKKELLKGYASLRRKS
ncbi:MAG: glycosyltransferase family 4 protein [Candidatus Eisenbacteria bacterium]|nr:glycosyltransferase family 4 protein [Candidatus Eisenbacteria bacterium]